MNISIFTMSLNKGGAERVITNLCNEYLVKEGNRVTIITCINMQPQYSLNSRICHICLDNDSLQKNQNKIQRFIRRRKSLIKILDCNKPDILLCILPEPSFLALSCKRQFTFPMVVSVRSDPAMEYTFFPYKILMNYFYPQADGLIMQTKEAKEYFSNRIQEKAIVIPNPINMDAVRHSFEGTRRREIVAVGRLVPEKNYPLLIKAFNKISSKYPEYKLIIYGEGPLRKQLEEMICGMDLEGKIILAGQRDNIFDLLYQSEMFVMTSSHEGMPNALMEAMALGLPVISTDCPCGGPRFLIQNEENGLLVPLRNEDALIQAIERLLENPDFGMQLGKQAEKIVNRLDPQKIYKMWDDYINRIVYNTRNKNAV